MTPEQNAAAFKAYLQQCDECAIVPDVAGAFNAGARASLAQPASVPAVQSPAEAHGLAAIAQRSLLEKLMTDLAGAVFYRDVDKIDGIRKEILDAANVQPKVTDLNLNDPAVQKRLAAQWGYVQAPAHAPDERDRLRAAQDAAVMPLIGPLLDAWEQADREVMDDEPELAKWLKAINTAMETAGEDQL